MSGKIKKESARFVQGLLNREGLDISKQNLKQFEEVLGRNFKSQMSPQRRVSFAMSSTLYGSSQVASQYGMSFSQLSAFGKAMQKGDIDNRIATGDMSDDELALYDAIISGSFDKAVKTATQNLENDIIDKGK